MLHWIPFAFVRITLFFILGILTGIYFPDHTDSILLIPLTGAILLIYILITLIIRKRNFLRWNLIISVVAFLAIYLLGITHVYLSRQDQSANHILNIKDIEAYTGIIVQHGVEKAKTIKYDLIVKQVKTSDGWRNAEGQLIAYIDKESRQPVYGDKLLIKKVPSEFLSPANPHQFNYKRYVNLQGIYHQQYLREGDFKVYERGYIHPLLSYAYDIRIWALAVFDHYIESPKERSIVQALILGVKDNLDRDTKSAYASSGTMHILAVSGLHVGIIYGFFYFLLAPLRRSNKTRWLFALVVLFGLWTYAAITGFSPSVSRAVTMFSFIVVAEASGRSTNIYNTLAASAFILLLYDPLLILSVGFQLSFLAVLGIVYIQPKLYQWLPIENWLLEKAWSLTTVAIAVQLVTFPLGLFYFHQFPSYFFISNLVAIPAALFILILGIGLLVISPASFLAGIVGYLLEYLVYGLNYIMSWMQELPFNKISDVNISIYQLWLLYAFTFSLVFMFTFRKYNLIYITLMAAVIFSIMEWHTLAKSRQNNKLIIYNMGNNTAFDFIHDRQSILYGDTVVCPGSDDFEFNIHANHIKSGVRNVNFHDLVSPDLMTWKNMKFITHQNKQLVLFESGTGFNFDFKDKIKVDYIILSKNAEVEIQWLNDNFSFIQIIIDQSVTYWTHIKLKKQLEVLSIPYHSVRESGAFEVDL